MNPGIDKELREHLERLPAKQQRQVLEFARALASGTSYGTAGGTLRRFGGVIGTCQ